MTTGEQKILDAIRRYEKRKMTPDEKREYREHGMPWRIEIITGDRPTPNQSAVFSRALRELRRKNLVRLTRWENTRVVANVQLLAAGRAEETKVAK